MKRLTLLATACLISTSAAIASPTYYPVIDVTTNTLVLPKIISLAPGEETKYSSAFLECNQDYSICSVKDIKIVDCNKQHFSPSPCE